MIVSELLLKLAKCNPNAIVKIGYEYDAIDNVTENIKNVEEDIEDAEVILQS